MKTILIILKVLLVTALFFIQTVSCYASDNAVNLLIKHQAQFQQGDFSSLERLTFDELRNTRDDKKGTLYYGGLLLYFNGEKEKAELALRRVAHTKDSLWAREATRLVVYFMIRSARYNHVRPFLEGLLSNEEIRHDLELFYYHAFSLFLTREYDALKVFIHGTEDSILQKPQWTVTLRHRVAERHASFSYDLWSALLTMRVNSQNSGTLYNTLLSYKAEDMIANIGIFIERIYTDANIPMPNHIRTVLEAKLALQAQNANAEKTFLALAPATFVHSGMIEDLMSIAKKNKRQVWNILRVLAKARKQATNAEQKAHIDIARAYLYYEKEYYKNSYTLYKNVFVNKAVYRKLPPTVQNQALWRMLSSVIQIDSKSFVKTFDQVMQYSKNQKRFVNVLEEYLSVLLQKKQYAQLQKDYQYLSKRYPQNYVDAELNRWYFILKRINSAVDDNIDIQNSALDASGIFHRKWAYTSDSPFEYLLYTSNVTKNQFLGSWTIAEESATARHIIEETQRIVISETLLDGYFTYGLYNYAYEIILKNNARVSSNTVRKMARYLYHTKDYSSALALTKDFASKSLLFPQTEEDFLFLYPNTMFSSILHSMTTDPKELAVMYALMREESSFRPTIVSGAGAIGLTQLLPETAADIASRISYTSFDLNNPKDNITLGYNYYKYLVKYLKKPVYAFVAYNGGFGNLRKWKNAFGVSDSIVFADSLPFRETRNYMRKLVSSALIYALLYYDVPSNVMVEYVFPKTQEK